MDDIKLGKQEIITGKYRVTTNRANVNKELKRMIKEVGKEEIIELANIVKESIIYELRIMPIHKSMARQSQNFLREQIIKSIKAKIITDDDNKYHLRIIVDHPLARALNYGTGIYGPEGRVIMAKASRGYMFIPGMAFFNSSRSKRFSSELNKQFKKMNFNQFNSPQSQKFAGRFFDLMTANKKNYEQYTEMKKGQSEKYLANAVQNMRNRNAK